jgi:hypothetical protein
MVGMAAARLGGAAAELGDGRIALHAAEHGEDGEGEDGGQGVAKAATLARVGDFRQYVKEGKRGR